MLRCEKINRLGALALRWLMIGLAVVAGWLTGAEFGMFAASAQNVSYRLRLPRISDRARFHRQIRSKVRSLLMQQGFVIRSRRANRKGYHLDVSVAVEERFRSDEPAVCTIQLALQIVVMPEKRLVMNASSQGTSRFRKKTKFSRRKRDRLRKMAIAKVMHFFRSNLRRSINKIERKRRSLGKNRILGTRWRRGSRARWRARGHRGRPLRGKAPRWKQIAAGVDAVKHRPPQ